MVSAVSTVTTFWTPDTCRLVQWPLITTLLEMPLTLTALALHVTVWVALMPEMVRLSPAGAGGSGVGDDDGPAAGVCVIPPGEVGLFEGMIGVGNIVGKPLRETWCAVKRKIAAGRAIMPMTKTAAKIHHVRLLRELIPDDDGPGNDPP
jgi:hypothetical protein